MINYEEIASDWGLRFDVFQAWLERFSPDNEHLKIAHKHFTRTQGFKMVVSNFRPLPYLLAKPELTKPVYELSQSMVKGLNVEEYQAHKEQLEFSDQLFGRSYPYDSYNAEVFTVLRHTKKAADCKFVKKMYFRSIRHHTFVDARNKLKRLALECT